MILVNDKNILDHNKITLNLIRQISREGKKMLNNKKNTIDSTDMALIISADNFLKYNKFNKDVVPIVTKKDALNCFNGFYAAIAMDCFLRLKNDPKSDMIKKEIAERAACALFYIIWNIGMNNDNVEYKKIPTLSYSLDLSRGVRCISKIGFFVVHPDDPEDRLYFDLLKLCREFINEDVVETNVGPGVDSGSCAYRLRKEMHRVCRDNTDLGKPPERIAEIIDEYRNGSK